MERDRELSHDLHFAASGGDPSGGTGGAGTGGSGMGGWDPEAGWTNFDETADTIKVYVSSSDGDDSNDAEQPELR